jgi:erythronate-4-phosphate dehydrogenase
MRIVVDENIAYAAEAFSQFGTVELKQGREITNDILFDADALIIRSITNVNENLLKNTKVKFVGTATIGNDHVDLEYLKANGVDFVSAQGCNADAVAEYVLTALTKIAKEKALSLDKLSLGVIGVGNIGSRVVRFTESLGMEVLKNDPPLQRITGRKDFIPIEEVLRADVLTLHVPLTFSGTDKTFHLLSNKNLNRLKENCILINTSRGAVIDNNALNNLIPKKSIVAVLDVWEDEPFINTDLLRKVYIGTPHIAGYSLEGKFNGTKMIADALSKFLGKESLWVLKLSPPNDPHIYIDKYYSREDALHAIIKRIYDIEKDNTEMRKMIGHPPESAAIIFDELRKNYPLRREFFNYTVGMKEPTDELNAILTALRFKTDS